MKKAFATAIALLILVSAQAVHADVIAYWAFPGTVPASGDNFKIVPPISASLKANPGAAEITTDALIWDGTLVGATAHQQGNLQYFTGFATSTIIQPGFVAGADLSLRSTTADPSNGKSFTFQFDSTGYTGLSMQYDERFTANGASAVAISWSTDGVNFTPTTLGYNTVRNSTYALRTVDFSTITGLENVATGYIRFTFSGYANGGTSRFDNITILGVPEPGTIVLLGLAALTVTRRKR